MSTHLLATIGVYGWTLTGFLDALHANRIPLVLDVRQRRGVRGSEYAWANARRLERALADAAIEYRHLKELAPTTELRRLQYAEDAKVGVGRRERTALALEYRRRYLAEILDDVDLLVVARALPAALLCVEREPEACHRSLVAERVAAEHEAVVVHLLPRRT